MPYIEGETVAARIRRSPPGLEECVDVAVQVADALAEAHAHGIVHRDVKPENVMLTGRGQAKVMDFGVARIIQDKMPSGTEETTRSVMTEPGRTVGTVPYMSPEQVRGGTVDTRSDIFSFGALLYEMITRHPPFAAESAGATFSAILTREPRPLGYYAADVPAELQRIVRKCLEKKPDRRYQSARDLVIDLKNLERGAGADPDTASANWSTRWNAAMTSRVGLVASAIAILLATAIVFALRFPRAAQARLKSSRSQCSRSDPCRPRAMMNLSRWEWPTP